VLPRSGLVQDLICAAGCYAEQTRIHKLISLQLLILSLGVTFITSFREAVALAGCLRTEKEVCDVRDVLVETIEIGVC